VASIVQGIGSFREAAGAAMARGGGVDRCGSPPARLLALVVVVACTAVVGDAKVGHVEEGHRRSMLANGLGSAPPMG
jgi:alpha-galactosidase